MKKNAGSVALTVAGAVLCAVFSFLLVCNVTIIVKGTLHPETPPTVLGVAPMVVLSGSMSGTAEDHIEVGDLIFTTKPDTEALQVGDVVAFKDGNVVVTHRIVAVTADESGKSSSSPRATPTTRRIRPSTPTVLSACTGGASPSWATLPCSCRSRWAWRCSSVSRCAPLSSEM